MTNYVNRQEQQRRPSGQKFDDDVAQWHWHLGRKFVQAGTERRWRLAERRRCFVIYLLLPKMMRF